MHGIWYDENPNFLYITEYSCKQVKFLVGTIIFWSVVLLIPSIIRDVDLKQYLNDISKAINSKIQHRIWNIFDYPFGFIKKLQITRVNNAVKAFQRRFHFVLSIVDNFKRKTQSSSNLSQLFVSYFHGFLNLFETTNRLFRSVGYLFSTGVKQATILPKRIKTTYHICVKEIRSFRQTIEQIIQILRLPLAILGLIHKFVVSIILFLNRIKAPRIPKIV
jgi:hypothetical protein